MKPSNAPDKMTPGEIYVLLIEDLPLKGALKKNMVRGFQPQLLIDEVWDRSSARNRLLQKNYHLIMIDVQWSRKSEEKLIDEICRIDPAPRIIFFTHSAHNASIGGYVGRGCWAFLDRCDDASALNKAVNMVLAGKNYVSPALVKELIFWPGSTK
jgi:DNA-binding NarL/FixJ family response regulator